MTACPHVPKYPALPTMATLQEAMAHCSLVQDNDKVSKQRALTSPDGETTRIDADYWSKLDEAQRAAVVAHERAHPSIGMEIDCEGCADKVGGYYMRIWGFAPSTVRQAFATLRVKRRADHGNIADNAVEGAHAAEAALAGRGLLGAPTTRTTQTLSRLRLSAATAAPPVATSAATSTTGTPLATALPSAPTTTDHLVRSPVRDATRAADAATPAAPPPLEGPSNVKITDPSFEKPPVSVGAAKDPTTPPKGSDIAGDVVSSILGEEARPHATKVLVAAGIAAAVAVVLVVIVRNRP